MIRPAILHLAQVEEDFPVVDAKAVVPVTGEFLEVEPRPTGRIVGDMRVLSNQRHDLD